MFGLFGRKTKAEPQHEYITARLNARIQPMERGEFYEDPLEDVLSAKDLGAVTGGGTQLADEPAGIEFCDLEIRVTEASEETLSAIVQKLEALGAPKGSKLIVESADREIAFGAYEGMAVFLNATDLKDEVYEACDFDEVTENFNTLMGEAGAFRGYWHGSSESAVYCYGPSFAAMKAAIEPFLQRYPLCEGARVEQIA